MIALLQRVTRASVVIDDKLYSSINHGYVCLLGIFNGDVETDSDLLVSKIAGLRVMADAEGKMNNSIEDTHGEILVVSQFTLCADVKKGRRPSFIDAMKPELAIPLYEQFVSLLEKRDIPVKTGVFGADMELTLTNNGPVTIILDSRYLK